MDSEESNLKIFKSVLKRELAPSILVTFRSKLSKRHVFFFSFTLIICFSRNYWKYLILWHRVVEMGAVWKKTSSASSISWSVFIVLTPMKRIFGLLWLNFVYIVEHQIGAFPLLFPSTFFGKSALGQLSEIPFFMVLYSATKFFLLNCRI